MTQALPFVDSFIMSSDETPSRSQQRLLDISQRRSSVMAYGLFPRSPRALVVAIVFAMMLTGITTERTYAVGSLGMGNVVFDGTTLPEQQGWSVFTILDPPFPFFSNGAA